MPVLIFRAPDGVIQERQFSAGLCIGTASDNEFCLPPDLLIAPHHAVIVRSEILRLPVLVDLTNGAWPTRVNGRRVVQLKTLQHYDGIELGHAQLKFWEINLQEIGSGSLLLEKKCPVDYKNFCAGDQVVACPRCQTVHHKHCWFLLSVCSLEGCGYPVQERIRRALASWVHFEKLDETSSLVKEKKLCLAGKRRDQSPFKDQEFVAYCPACNTPFHVVCWLALQQCPVCQYEIAGLLERILAPKIASGTVLREKRL